MKGVKKKLPKEGDWVDSRKSGVADSGEGNKRMGYGAVVVQWEVVWQKIIAIQLKVVLRHILPFHPHSHKLTSCFQQPSTLL